MKHLLVTGGAGFIGSSFVRLALGRGYRVTVLDKLTYAGRRENLAGIDSSGAFKLVVGDIRDRKQVAELLDDVHGLIHFAAESHVDRSITGPGEFIDTNIIGTYTLLLASLDYWKNLGPGDSFRYLQVSTDEVYGSLGPTGKFSETTPMAPNSPYSASKASADLLVRAWHHTYGLPVITTHCSNNYGPRQFPEKLIPLMIRHALTHKPLPVYGDGGNVRDWIHVEDHCEGVLAAFEKGRSGSTYCFGGNAERNNLDVVQTICKILDRLKPRQDAMPHATGITYVKDRLGHDRRYAIDDRLAERELGFKRRYDFDSGLKATIEWYLENEAWIESVTTPSTP